MPIEQNDSLTTISFGPSYFEYSQVIADLSFRCIPPAHEAIKLGFHQIASLNISPSDFESYQNTYKSKLVNTDFISRVSAVEAVIAALLWKETTNWRHVLSIVSENWPVWGFPYIYAADAFIDQGDLDAAANYLYNAHLLIPVGHYKFPRLLDKLRKNAKSINRIDLDILANRLLIFHKPIISNLARLAETADKCKDYESQNLVVNRCKEIYGLDPDKWLVADTYDDLSAAGTLCMQINRITSKIRNKSNHNYVKLNKNAICFFKAALVAAKNVDSAIKPKFPEEYCHTRIGECYAQTIRFAYAEADELGSEALDWIKSHGCIDGKHAYAAQRQLEAVLTGMARRARELQKTPEEIEEYVDAAHQAYERTWQLAYHNRNSTLSKKEKVAEWHYKFLLEFERYEAAEQVATRLGNPLKGSIVAIFRMKSRRVAVKKLVEILGHQMKAEDALEYGLRLSWYLDLIERDHVKIPDMLRASAEKRLKACIRLFVSVCKDSLQRNNLTKAKHCLQAARRAETDPNSIILLDLELRIIVFELSRGLKSASEKIPSIFKVLSRVQANKMDARLRGVILSALAKTGARRLTLNSTDVWRLVVPNDFDQPDKIGMLHALKWEIRSSSLENWIDHMAEAAANFHPDLYFARLPRYLERSSNSSKAVLIPDLVDRYIKDQRYDWLYMILNWLPGDTFFTEPFLGRIANSYRSLRNDKITSTQDLNRILAQIVNGFLRGQLEVLDDHGLCRLRCETSANWVIQNVSSQDLISAWTQWFGGERGLLYRQLLKNMHSKVMALHKRVLDLDASNATVADWKDECTNFLKENVSPSLEATTFEGQRSALAIISFCNESLETYEPSAPDPNYWTSIRELVSAHFRESDATDNSAEAAVELWFVLYDYLNQKANYRLAQMLYPTIHRFKNDLGSFSSAERPTPTLKSRLSITIRQTAIFLKGHGDAKLKPIDLCNVIAHVSYRPPFVVTQRRQFQVNAPTLYPVRPASPIVVDGDWGLLNEMLRSLLQNSCLHTPEAGKGGCIWCQLRLEGDQAVIEVRDNGVGADRQTLERLNDHNSSPFSKNNSTGYGSKFCHRIVRLHHGSIHYHSDGMDAGLTVTVTLPILKGTSQ